MKDNHIVRLLILDDSQNDAEVTSNLFRNCGLPTRAHRLESIDELPMLIAQEAWDLLIAATRGTAQTPTEVISLLDEQPDRIPVLLVAEEPDKVRPEALEAGVREVIAKGDHQHLLHAAMREVNNHKARLESRHMRAKLEELQARYELLMGGSQDAIAYITDGMHVDVNEAYANCFGYDEPDELACMPVIDLIADRDQEKFKEFLRGYGQGRPDANNREGATLDISARHQDGTERPLQMVFAPASYEGEACTQIVIRAAATAAPAPRMEPRRFLDDMRRLRSQCQREHRDAALVYLQLDNLPSLREALGVFCADEVANQLGSFLGGQLPGDAIHGRVCTDGIAVMLPKCSADEALRCISRTLESIHQHFFDVDGRTARCQCLAAVLPLTEQPDDAIESLIDRAYRGIIELRSEGGRQAAIYKPPAAPIQLGNTKLDLNALHAEGRLSVLFQPVVSLRGDAGEYYEATAVLREADGSELDLRQLASGMLHESKGSLFDRWLLFNTTKQLATKRAEGSDTRLIVNVSPACLRDGELCSWLSVSLHAAGLPAAALTLQLDESDAKASIHQAGRLFGELNKLGCGTSLTNFGQSDDSQDILQRSGAKVVKVRAQTLDNGTIDDKSRQALRHVLNDTVSSSTTTIVSNVASAATLATLWQLGAGFIQGPYLQEPAPEMEYEFAEIA